MIAGQPRFSQKSRNHLHAQSDVSCARAPHHSVSFFAFLTATVEEATDIPLRSLRKSKGCPKLPRMPTELTSLGSKSTCKEVFLKSTEH